MLDAVPQLVASILLVVAFSVFKHAWQTSTIGQVYALVVFSAVQAGSVILVFMSTNTSLAATTTISVASIFAAAIFAKPAWRFLRRRKIRKTEVSPKSATGRF